MVQIVGHRGAAGHAPENTLRGFQRAVELGADIVEFDVRESADDELVVIHDETVEDTTDGQGRVDELTVSELQTLDAGEGATIPTFEETLEFFTDVDVDLRIEQKVPGLGERILAGVEEHGFEDRTSVVSFDPEAIREIIEAGAGPKITRSLTTGDPDETLFENAEKLGCSWVSMSYSAVTAELVETAHDRGLEVGMFTLNEPSDIDDALTLDPDYLCSNYPDRVRDRL
jgi:glycerophosphoryl diester phosphodiesterase